MLKIGFPAVLQILKEKKFEYFKKICNYCYTYKGITWLCAVPPATLKNLLQLNFQPWLSRSCGHVKISLFASLFCWALCTPCFISAAPPCAFHPPLVCFASFSCKPLLLRPGMCLIAWPGMVSGCFSVIRCIQWLSQKWRSPGI